MPNIKELLKDNLINKDELIIKRYSYLNLDKSQAKFVSKIFKNKKLDYSQLTIEEISLSLSVDYETAETIVLTLVTNGYIKLINLEEEIKFNFEPLIYKLIKTYSSPKSKDNIDEKINWIKRKVSFELTNNNIQELIKISNENWDSVLLITNKISESKEQNWPLFISLYNTYINKNIEKSNQIKSILDTNWLE